MKTICAALLVALSGKEVTEDAIKAVFKSVGAKQNDAEIKSVVAALKGKKPEDVVAEGLKKLSSAGPVAAGGAHEEKHEDKKEGGKDKGGKDKGGKDKGKKEEKKKEEKKKEEEEDDDAFDIGGLF